VTVAQEVQRWVEAGGAIAILAVFFLYVGPRMLDKRVETLEVLARTWAQERDRDRQEQARLFASLEHSIAAAAAAITAALAGRHAPGDYPHG